MIQKNLMMKTLTSSLDRIERLVQSPGNSLRWSRLMIDFLYDSSSICIILFLKKVMRIKISIWHFDKPLIKNLANIIEYESFIWYQNQHRPPKKALFPGFLYYRIKLNPFLEVIFTQFLLIDWEITLKRLLKSQVETFSLDCHRLCFPSFRLS